LVLADVGSTIFNGWCPKAAAKFEQLEVLTAETLSKVVRRVAEKCVNATAGQPGSSKGDARAVVLEGLKGNTPLVKKVAEALTEAKSCGCNKVAVRCLWCDAKQQAATPLALAQQFVNASSMPKPKGKQIGPVRRDHSW
jgi:hypothetical protein